MGSFNTIWQGDANAMALCSFDHTTVPPRVVNLTGPETLSVRRVVERFGQLFRMMPIIIGHEAPDALLSNAQQAFRLFGYPHVGVDMIMERIAGWIARGGEFLDKPTHFESRDGKF
jgi:hypothetical protein